MSSHRFLLCGLSLLMLPAVGVAGIEKAESALQIYQQHLASEPAGIYEHSDLVFFIADQKCFAEKKFAGTKESKAASHAAMVLMAKKARESAVGISRNDIAASGLLGDDIYEQYVKNQNLLVNKALGAGNRLFDANIEACRRRVVYSLSTKALEQQAAIQTSVPDIKALQAAVFTQALQNKDYERLGNYFDSLQQPELAVAFAAAAQREEILSYPVAINWFVDGKALTQKREQCATADKEMTSLALTLKAEVVTHLSSAFCGQPIELGQGRLGYLAGTSQDIGKYQDSMRSADLFGVVQRAIEQQGLVFFQTPDWDKSLTATLNKQAEALFKSGKEPQQIVTLFTRSLNIDPNQSQIWLRLAAVFQAFGHSGVASSLILQAMVQNPDNTDSWLQLAQALSSMGLNEQSEQLLQTTSSLASAFPFSEWGVEKLQQLTTKR